MAGVSLCQGPIEVSPCVAWAAPWGETNSLDTVDRSLVFDGQQRLFCCIMVPGRGSRGGLCGSATRQGIPGRRLIETMAAGCGLQAVSRLVLRPIGSIDLLMPGKLMPQTRRASPTDRAPTLFRRFDTGDPAETSGSNDAPLRTDATLGCASADEANTRKTKLSNRTRTGL